MDTRVLATDAAKRAAGQMRVLLEGDLLQRTREALQALRVLGSPGVWDGPTAATFRQSLAPQIQSSLTSALRSLQQLQQYSDHVVADIIHAGSSGTMSGGGNFSAHDQPVPPGPPEPAQPPPPEPPAPTPPVLDQKTKDMLAYFRQHVNGSGFWGDQGILESIDGRLAQLTPAERAAFLSQLSPAELQNWNKQITRGGGWFFQSEGLTTSDRLQLANLLIGSADPASLATLEANMPALVPNAHNSEETPSGWTSTSGQPLFGPGGTPVVGDVNQGNEGDCWFLAGLGAVAMKDPSLIQQNIHQNANGTYTVTFYRDGGPVQVTVTDSVPGTSAYGDYAHPGTGDGATWVQIYEKAYAQLNGGYGPIEGGLGDRALGSITGQPAWHVPLVQPMGMPPLSLGEIAGKLDSGYAMTTGTSDGKDWPWSHEPNRLDGGWLVPSHEYIVQSVNTGANPPTITLLNPWGQNSAGPPDPNAHGQAPETVTLTQDQWHRYFTEVSLAQMKQ